MFSLARNGRPSALWIWLGGWWYLPSMVQDLARRVAELERAELRRRDKEVQA